MTDMELVGNDELAFGEIGPAAFEAAATFVRAVWEHRQHLTIISAFGYGELLARWRDGSYDDGSDTAPFLDGDVELPEDVERAAGALYDLVFLYDGQDVIETPGSGLTLEAARLLWIDVAKRLRVIASRLP